ncbi:hypothetical protein FB45DRAFT_427213 [Roridomyces roridus]|uniref:Uncharacterized protein n=1 Tax=Roridomyces roridus TaxID=1738132 RepID=A0AAD7C600_9AGAR|nr:hypothetical protein FB45DRAFT_427213 [Roridomyces roridus]
MSNDIVLLYCFIAFVVGQLFNSVCLGLASPVVPVVPPPPASPVGWSLPAVIVIVLATLVVHDAFVFASLWLYLEPRRLARQKTAMASRALLPARLLQLFVRPPRSPRRLLLLPSPPTLTSLRPTLVVNIAYLARRSVLFAAPTWWLTVPRARRVLRAPEDNNVMLQLVRKALASLKAVKLAVKTFEDVKITQYDLVNLGVVIYRPLRVPSVWRVRVFPRVQQELTTRILLLVSDALAVHKTSKLATGAFPYDQQDDSRTLVEDDDASVDAFDELKVLKSGSAAPASDLQVVAYSPLAALFQKTKAKDGLSPVQDVEATSKDPLPQPPVSFLDKIPIAAFFQNTIIGPESYAFIEEPDDEAEVEVASDDDEFAAGLQASGSFSVWDIEIEEVDDQVDGKVVHGYAEEEESLEEEESPTFGSFLSLFVCLCLTITTATERHAIIAAYFHMPQPQAARPSLLPLLARLHARMMGTTA